MDWSLTVGVTGLVVTVAGFAVTITQLLRTARATQAVNSAVSNLRNRMATFDYASECLRAGKSLQHAVRLLRLKEWQDAAATLVEVQGALHRLSMSGEGQEETRRLAGETAESLLNAIIDLEDAFEKDLELDPKELIMTLRKQGNLLDSEVISINRDLYNV